MEWLASTVRAIAASVVLVSSLAGGVAEAQVAASAPAILSAACAAGAAGAAATISPSALFKCFSKATFLVSRAAQHLVAFETRDNADPRTATSFADVVAATGEALMNIADRRGGKSALARIDAVAIAIGGAPSASLAGGVLTITIVPLSGRTGQPSTEQIQQAALTVGPS